MLCGLFGADICVDAWFAISWFDASCANAEVADVRKIAIAKVTIFLM